ncbi:diguanylate cyclase domain-containing protein [Rivularia sp. UHCC 0363]|uniref:diguanylate cyclase domain-containing protein n=1 Tax=Rivularia sp. UHCC 0363 TaxID=3110244 RepID=UPI002B1FEDFE|nr:diguanylate cyclase [Rivularia sp. UHCC 0363]MEA5594249.1 diguanylate cyclase [Rivularia sp. UHCC 0363]
MKKIRLFILERVYFDLWYAVLGIVSSIEEVILRVVKSFSSLLLIDICLIVKAYSERIANIIQNYYADSVFYLTDIYESLKTTDKPFAYLFKLFIKRDLHMAIEMAIYKQQICKGLRQEKQQLSVIINSMGCGVIVTDINSCIEIINPVAEALTGWQRKEAIGKNLLEVFQLKDAETEEEIDNLAARVIETGEVLSLPENCKLIAKDGSETSIGDNVAPMRDEDGKILGAVLVFQDISQRKKTEAELIQNAFYDSITGLPNRVLFRDRLTQAFEHSKRRKNYRFSVLFLDLDGFKGINDKFGHGMGDKLLVDISQLVKSSLRGGDTVARFGGDEFAILLEDIKDVKDATNVALRIQENLETPFDINERKILITASIGIALSSISHEEPANLLDEADSAMYQAKERGKAQYVLFERE